MEDVKWIYRRISRRISQKHCSIEELLLKRSLYSQSKGTWLQPSEKLQNETGGYFKFWTKWAVWIHLARQMEFWGMASLWPLLIQKREYCKLKKWRNRVLYIRIATSCVWALFFISVFGKMPHYGIYVLNDNVVFLNLRISVDIGLLSVDSFRRWWYSCTKQKIASYVTS